MDRKVSHGHSRQKEKHVCRFFLPETVFNWSEMGSRCFSLWGVVVVFLKLPTSFCG